MCCTNCNKESDTVFFTESFLCGDCGSKISIAYHTCRYCSYMWKTANDNVLVGEPVNLDALEKLFDSNSLLSDLISNEDAFTDLMNSLVVEDVNSVSMMDYVDRCIKCNKICYEQSKNVYKCPDCDFEWEVLD